MESAIRVRGFVKRFGSITAVDGLDLEVPFGACVGLLGPNGAGKSTTMKALTAQVIADEGEIDVLGYRLPEDSKQARAEMGVVPQLDNLDVSLTVEQNLLVFAHLYRVPAGERKAAIERALEHRQPPRSPRLQGRPAQRRHAAPAADHARPAARTAARAARRADRRAGPAGAPGAVGADRPAALGGRVDPDEHPLHRGGGAPLRHRHDHVPRQGCRGGRARRPDPRARWIRGDRGLRVAGAAARGRGRREHARLAHAAHRAPRWRSCTATARPTSTASAGSRTSRTCSCCSPARRSPDGRHDPRISTAWSPPRCGG